MSDGAPLAKLFGEAIKQAPEDLFIPPDALRVFLDRFEGPLDLLLYLIRKQNIDILDIPISRVTRQYLEYIAAMDKVKRHLAAEYLLMAAMLIEIKSRLLLPVPPLAGSEEDTEEDPRLLLAQRLLAYEQMKQAALRLDELPRAERDFMWLTLTLDDMPEVLPKVSVEDMLTAIQSLYQRKSRLQEHTIVRAVWTVDEQMVRIEELLNLHDMCRFEDLFVDTMDASYVVVTFIAVLEMARQNKISVDQVEQGTTVYLRRHEVEKQ